MEINGEENHKNLQSWPRLISDTSRIHVTCICAWTNLLSMDTLNGKVSNTSRDQILAIQLIACFFWLSYHSYHEEHKQQSNVLTSSLWWQLIPDVTKQARFKQCCFIVWTILTLYCYKLIHKLLLFIRYRLDQWYSTWGTHTPGGTRRHLRGERKI
jgi:hypothetical protein